MVCYLEFGAVVVVNVPDEEGESVEDGSCQSTPHHYSIVQLPGDHKYDSDPKLPGAHKYDPHPKLTGAHKYDPDPKIPGAHKYDPDPKIPGAHK